MSDKTTYLTRRALLSQCHRYRYTLDREWEGTGYRAWFVMLNPSTADAELDDPTIRRCMGFAVAVADADEFRSSIYEAIRKRFQEVVDTDPRFSFVPELQASAQQLVRDMCAVTPESVGVAS